MQRNTAWWAWGSGGQRVGGCAGWAGAPRVDGARGWRPLSSEARYDGGMHPALLRACFPAAAARHVLPLRACSGRHQNVCAAPTPSNSSPPAHARTGHHKPHILQVVAQRQVRRQAEEVRGLQAQAGPAAGSGGAGAQRGQLAQRRCSGNGGGSGSKAPPSPADRAIKTELRLILAGQRSCCAGLCQALRLPAGLEDCLRHSRCGHSGLTAACRRRGGAAASAIENAVARSGPWRSPKAFERVPVFLAGHRSARCTGLASRRVARPP